MKQTLVDVSLTILAITIVSCLVSIMTIFMGAEQSGTDLQGLMYLQALLTPIALGVVSVIVYGFVSAHGWAKGLQAMWLALPQWLVFIFLLLNSLVLFGELAFVVVMKATEQVVHWYQHVPLVAMLLCSSAFLAVYARNHSYPGSKPAMSGRWM